MRNYRQTFKVILGPATETVLARIIFNQDEPILAVLNPRQLTTIAVEVKIIYNEEPLFTNEEVQRILDELSKEDSQVLDEILDSLEQNS